MGGRSSSAAASVEWIPTSTSWTSATFAGNNGPARRQELDGLRVCARRSDGARVERRRRNRHGDRSQVEDRQEHVQGRDRYRKRELLLRRPSLRQA